MSRKHLWKFLTLSSLLITAPSYAAGGSGAGQSQGEVCTECQLRDTGNPAQVSCDPDALKAALIAEGQAIQPIVQRLDGKRKDAISAAEDFLRMLNTLRECERLNVQPTLTDCGDLGKVYRWRKQITEAVTFETWISAYEAAGKCKIDTRTQEGVLTDSAGKTIARMLNGMWSLYPEQDCSSPSGKMRRSYILADGASERAEGSGALIVDFKHDRSIPDKQHVQKKLLLGDGKEALQLSESDAGSIRFKWSGGGYVDVRPSDSRIIDSNFMDSSVFGASCETEKDASGCFRPHVSSKEGQSFVSKIQEVGGSAACPRS